jgi:hypothetical protein
MFWRRQSDFNAEVKAHLGLEAEHLREKGLSEEDARAAARRNFGNVTPARRNAFRNPAFSS